jgi:dipeptidase E
VKYLLTSAGIENETIETALVELLGKPISEANALCIPTAVHPMSPAGVWRIITGNARTRMCEAGWKSLGVLELTALPSIGKETWLPAVTETDALLVSGGDPLYLSYWMQQSGLADLLGSLRPEMVYLGVSAGSTVLGPTVGEEFVGWKPPGYGDDARTLGIVDFAMFPHVDHPDLPDNNMGAAEQWAAGVGVPAYAVDDDTAIRVVDGNVDVISEGHWRQFTPERQEA